MVWEEERLSSRLQVMGWGVQWEGEREVMYLVWRETETRAKVVLMRLEKKVVRGLTM
jgi:hypothetical protein